jgi:hypothetical protein
VEPAFTGFDRSTCEPVLGRVVNKVGKQSSQRGTLFHRTVMLASSDVSNDLLSRTSSRITRSPPSLLRRHPKKSPWGMGMNISTFGAGCPESRVAPTAAKPLAGAKPGPTKLAWSTD